MANFEDGSYGTLAGIALIAKVLAGRCKMEYTRVAAGSGLIPDGNTPKTMTGPAGYVMDAMISGISNPVDGECQITVQINSAYVEHGFYLTNLVLYALDPDEGEIAFTYLSLENEPEWIRPASSIVGKLATFDIISAVGDIDAVVATINPEAVATLQQVAQMITDYTAGIGCAVLEQITIPADGWQPAAEELAGCAVYVDVNCEESAEEYYPDMALDRASLEAAQQAGLCPTMQALDGILRFWAKRPPEQPLTGTVALLTTKGSAATGLASYVLPIASSTTLGGIKVQAGSGLTIDGEGNLAVDAASAQDVEELYNAAMAGIGQS